MNWYRVRTQHDNFHRGDMVLLDGGYREAVLEQWGYLEFVRVAEAYEETPPGPSEPEPEFLAAEPATKDEAVAPKRGRRGKSTEARSTEDEPVESVSGDEPRGEDMPPHRA